MKYNMNKAAIRLLTERNSYTGLTLQEKQALQQSRNRMKNTLCNALGYTDMPDCIDALREGRVSTDKLLGHTEYDSNGTFEQRFHAMLNLGRVGQ
jgi:hypothetical protein